MGTMKAATAIHLLEKVGRALGDVKVYQPRRDESQTMTVASISIFMPHGFAAATPEAAPPPETIDVGVIRHHGLQVELLSPYLGRMVVDFDRVKGRVRWARRYSSSPLSPRTIEATVSPERALDVVERLLVEGVWGSDGRGCPDCGSHLDARTGMCPSCYAVEREGRQM